MKKITIILMFSFLSSFSHGQFIYSDFEGQQNFQFLGWPNEPEIVSNPDPSGINTSAYVGKFEREFYEFCHVSCYTEGRILFESNPVFTMKVWSPIACEILFKLENSVSLEIAIEVSSSITTPNQWEELSFDFSGQAVGYYDKVVVFFDFASFNTNTFYFDDVEGAPIESFSPYSATFNVDMTEATEFNPETDDVYIAGSFADWQQPGTNPDLVFEPTPENPMIYTLTVDEIAAGYIQYKYFRVIDGQPSWDWGEWMGDPNREVYINGNIIINDTWGIIIPPEEEIIANFEYINLLNIDEVIGCGNWNNLPISETFFTVANPDPNGINTSSIVMKFLRRGIDDGGETAAGYIAYNTLNVSDYDFLHVMVWKPKISPLKIRSHGFIYDYEAFNLNPQTNTGVWEDIVFDLRDFEQALDYFYFMPDYEDPLTSNELTEIFFDNIRLSNDSTPLIISINNFSALETSICENSSVSFIPDTSNVEYDSVLWVFQGGNPATSAVLFPTVEYANPGNFDVSLSAWHNGQSNLINKTNYIEVIPIPEAPAMPTGSDVVCFGESETEYYTNSELAIWELLPTNAGSMNYYDSTCRIIWNQNFTGEASLKVKIYNECDEGEFSEPLLIQKLESSGADFDASQTLFVNQPYTVQFTNLTPDQENFDFFWDFGNGETSTEVQPEYTYPEKGEYTVSLAATNLSTGCADTLAKENFIFCSGVGIDDEGKDGFNYYIDQSGTSLHLNFGNQPENLLFSLYDMLGIMQKTTVLVEKNSTVLLNGLAPGMYFFVIDKKTTGKIMIIQ